MRANRRTATASSTPAPPTYRQGPSSARRPHSAAAAATHGAPSRQQEDQPPRTYDDATTEAVLSAYLSRPIAQRLASAAACGDLATALAILKDRYTPVAMGEASNSVILAGDGSLYPLDMID